jgi:uncharacterized protein (TIGR00251 family)
MTRQQEPTSILKVRVQPKASRNRIEGFLGDTLRVSVTAPPEDGKANQALIALLADRLDVARSRLEIVRGHASRDKLVAVVALDLSEIGRRLQVLKN